MVTSWNATEGRAEGVALERAGGVRMGRLGSWGPDSSHCPRRRGADKGRTQCTSGTGHSARRLVLTLAAPEQPRELLNLGAGLGPRDPPATRQRCLGAGLPSVQDIGTGLRLRRRALYSTQGGSHHRDTEFFPQLGGLLVPTRLMCS